MIILGIVLTAAGLLLLISFLFSRRCRTETEAVVVRIIEKKRYYRGRTVKDRTPVFTYTVNEKEYTAKADSSSSDPKKNYVGQKLTVFIDAAHPERVRSGSNAGFCIAGIVFAASGICTLILSFM